MANQNDVYEQIRSEHEELRELLGTVHRTLGKRLETVANVSEMLASLFEHVETHFTEEETTGFFDDVTQQAPRVSERVDELREEHKSLLIAIRHLAEAALGGDGSNDWWERLDREFHEFSKELMHHENKENELLQEVYTEDIGPAD